MKPNIMIIQCPNCGKMFNLKGKHSDTFVCPKCKFQAPFSLIIKNAQNSAGPAAPVITNPDTSLTNSCLPVGVLPTPPSPKRCNTPVEDMASSEKTRVVSIQEGGKTIMVPGLQNPSVPKKASFVVFYKNVKIGTVSLPASGNFTLGRRSSDGKANVTLSPDITMSRVHAGMRVMKNTKGEIIYQITTVKPANPVVVNGQPLAKGQPCSLKHGDKLTMGDTNLIFHLA